MSSGCTFATAAFFCLVFLAGYTPMSGKNLTPLDIYRLLKKDNCGRCHLPSCLAFAAAVVAGSKQPADCPLLASHEIARIESSLQPPGERVPDQAAFIDRLEKKVARLDLAAVAPRIGGRMQDGQLVINSLGKDFFVNSQGQLTSECHIITWVKAPLLSYVTNKEHQDITGEWISFREFQGGMEWQNLFTTRCENVLKGIADTHPGLFVDLIDLFMGRETVALEADIALILYPLPHFPLLICYQEAEEELDSVLTLFFDRCCAVNMDIKAIFTLCSGLVQMFAKIARLHS